MSILGSKDRNSPTVPESPENKEQRNIELLGQEFSIVKDGLDPKEVMAFLETIAGSSEIAFKRLEQFSAFQSVARTMDESIREARYLAEHAKERALAEAERERTKSIEDVKQQVSAILDETMKSCVSSIDNIHSFLLGAIAKNEEAQRVAFEKTREMVASNMAEIHQNLKDIVDGHYQHVDSETTSPADSDTTPHVEPPMPVVVNMASIGEVESINPGESYSGVDDPGSNGTSDYDLTNLQESLMNLEASLSNLNQSKSTMGQTITVEAPTIETMQAPVTEEVEDEQPDNPGSQVDIPVDDTEDDIETPAEDAETNIETQVDDTRQYQGDVTIEISGGAEESWMQELRQRMLDLSGARIRAESGVDDKTTMVNLSLDESVSLLRILTALPGVKKVVPGRSDADSDDKKLRFWSRNHKHTQDKTVTIELYSNGNDNGNGNGNGHGIEYHSQVDDDLMSAS